MAKKAKTGIILALLLSVIFVVLLMAIHQTNIEKSYERLRDSDYEIYYDGEPVESIEDIDIRGINYIIIDDESERVDVYTHMNFIL